MPSHECGMEKPNLLKPDFSLDERLLSLENS